MRSFTGENTPLYCNSILALLESVLTSYTCSYTMATSIRVTVKIPHHWNLLIVCETFISLHVYRALRAHAVTITTAAWERRTS